MLHYRWYRVWELNPSRQDESLLTSPEVERDMFGDTRRLQSVFLSLIASSIRGCLRVAVWTQQL